jgi:prepilin-type N-terminal cleavage/methylation domain-containing protein
MEMKITPKLNSAGFSFIEVMTVSVVLVVLSSIALATFDLIYEKIFTNIGNDYTKQAFSAIAAGRSEYDMSRSDVVESVFFSNSQVGDPPVEVNTTAGQLLPGFVPDPGFDIRVMANPSCITGKTAITPCLLEQVYMHKCGYPYQSVVINLSDETVIKLNRSVTPVTCN